VWMIARDHNRSRGRHEREIVIRALKVDTERRERADLERRIQRERLHPLVQPLIRAEAEQPREQRRAANAKWVGRHLEVTI